MSWKVGHVLLAIVLLLSPGRNARLRFIVDQKNTKIATTTTNFLDGLAVGNYRIRVCIESNMSYEAVGLGVGQGSGPARSPAEHLARLDRVARYQCCQCKQTRRKPDARL